jgi:pyruvate,orthophosphate dikinase
MSEELAQLLQWADDVRRMRVLANADSPEDARRARQFGAEGIGLCRTEHMFMAPERLPVVQRMILADSGEARAEALAQLLPMQQADFAGLFCEMNGLPVTVRLLDPPLHEFLPNLEKLSDSLSELKVRRTDALPLGIEELRRLGELETMYGKVKDLRETNPMMGQRGCRLGIVFPEIYAMQLQAVFRAAKQCLHAGADVKLRIMVPLVGHIGELRVLREQALRIAAEELGEHTRRCPFTIGTMIEVPRAALTAGQMAAVADFFSFGTNDLTQMTLGVSRDDAEGKFLSYYLERGLLAQNPFQSLDVDGVGRLIEMAVAQGLAVNPRLATGICGEHGGDKESIFFCHEAGLDSISCSPYRVPLARLAAAQAQIALGNPAVREKVVRKDAVS